MTLNFIHPYQVVLGGGRKNFFSKAEKDAQGYGGHRLDGINLIHEWLIKKKSRGYEPAYVQNRKELLQLDPLKHNSVLGLFAPEHLPYHLEATEDDPSLTDMTLKAIEVLSQNKNGFFLFVEGKSKQFK